MTSAFWDTSALVSLCVRQQASGVAREFSRQYKFVVWWSTPVELRSALERLVRMQQLSPGGHSAAIRTLDKMRRVWSEVNPSLQLRFQAEALLVQFPLRAADALQLAAAMTWAGGFPKNRVFVAADGQLLDAATQVGFQAIRA